MLNNIQTSDHAKQIAKVGKHYTRRDLHLYKLSKTGQLVKKTGLAWGISWLSELMTPDIQTSLFLEMMPLLLRKINQDTATISPLMTEEQNNEVREVCNIYKQLIEKKDTCSQESKLVEAVMTSLERPRAAPSSSRSTSPHLDELSPEGIRQLREELAKKIGYKAADLHILRAIFQGVADVEIPEFEAIEHEVIFGHVQQNFSEFNALYEEFLHIYRTTGSLELCEPVLKKIQVGIQRALLNLDDNAISEMIGMQKPLMVRSTGMEDSETLANPGGNLSVSNVTPMIESMRFAIGRVVASYFSLHSLTQRRSVGDDITAPPFMPVLLQVMAGERPGGPIPTSGVMYTQDQLKTPGVVKISSSFGHAEAVVTGSRPVDKYLVQGSHVHCIASDAKTTRLAPSANGGLISRQNPPDYRFRQSLSYNQAIRLAEIGKQVERAYGSARDIEWSFNPETGVFSLFQGRPPPQPAELHPTHVDPTQYSQFEAMSAVEVIGEGDLSVRLLSAENTLLVDAVDKQTIAIQERMAQAGKPVLAVISRTRIAPESHEAGYFNQLGIPVVYARDYDKVANDLKNKNALLDVQEGFVGFLPKATAWQELIHVGLKRYPIPKQESMPKYEMAENESQLFLENLSILSLQADKAEVERLIARTYARNRLDLWLSCYEMADSLGTKAYFLTRLLAETQVQASQAPEAVRKAVMQKILHNAHHLWTISTTAQEQWLLQEKYAISWLRNAIVEDKGKDVIGGDTLRSLMGENAERRWLGIVADPQLDDRQLYLDTFLRCSKFIINPQTRERWRIFCNELNTSQLQQLGGLFALLGPSVVEYGLNSSFSRASHIGNSAQCLQLLLEQASMPEFQAAVKIVTESRQVIQRFRASTSRFGDPLQFEAALRALATELDPQILQCLEALKTAQGVPATLLAQTFAECIDIYDASTKALIRSKNYKDSDLQATNFSLILERLLHITLTSMSPELLQGNPALLSQAKVLLPFLSSRFETLKRLAIEPGKGTRHLQLSGQFLVSRGKLGSGIMAPERMPPTTLEDFFTQLHQSEMTIVNHILQQRGEAIDMRSFPPPISTLDTMIRSLDSSRRSSPGSQHPNLQSVVFSYPNLEITYNCPMNNHSATFTIHGKMEKGALKSVVFEGQFFLSGAILAQREDFLFFYLLQICYQDKNGPLRPPEGYPPRIEGGSCLFQWEIPLGPSSDSLPGLMENHLQAMISFLQNNDANLIPPFSAFNILREYPQFAPSIFLELRRKISSDYPQFLRAVLDGFYTHPTDENLAQFVKYQGFLNEYLFPRNPSEAPILDPEDRRLQELLERAIQSDLIWNHPQLLSELAYFILFIATAKSKNPEKTPAEFKTVLEQFHIEEKKPQISARLDGAVALLASNPNTTVSEWNNLMRLCLFCQREDLLIRVLRENISFMHLTLPEIEDDATYNRCLEAVLDCCYRYPTRDNLSNFLRHNGFLPKGQQTLDLSDHRLQELFETAVESDAVWVNDMYSLAPLIQLMDASGYHHEEVRAKINTRLDQKVAQLPPYPEYRYLQTLKRLGEACQRQDVISQMDERIANYKPPPRRGRS